MEIRQWTARDDLRGALEVRSRTWRVAFRGVVEEDVRSVVAAEPDETAIDELADDVENEAGAFLVAVEEHDGESAGETNAGDSADDTDGDDASEGNGASDDDGSTGGNADDVVGFVRVRYGGTDEFLGPLESEVVDLYVDPAHWRDGIGTALLEAADEWTPATLEGVATEVLAANERGQAFLEANGFEPDETAERTLAGEPHETVWYRRDGQ